MRLLLATLALAGVLLPFDTTAAAPARIAQMARDVTDAVRKQRAERRARPHQNQRSTDETKR